MYNYVIQSAKRGPIYSLCDYMYLATCNLTCECVVNLKFGLHITGTMAWCNMKVICWNIRSYGVLNLTVWKGYKAPFRRLGHIYNGYQLWYSASPAVFPVHGIDISFTANVVYVYMCGFVTESSYWIPSI